MGKVNIVACLDGSCGLLYRRLQAGNLVDGGIVAHHHSVKAQVTTQDVSQNPVVGHTVGIPHGMVARHESLTILQPYHCLVRQYYLFHEFFFLSVAASTISEVVLGTCSHALLQVALL